MQSDGSTTEPICHADRSYDAALALMLAEAAPLGIDIAALSQAGGRRLAEAVPVGIDAPRSDVAAMDGYAVGTADAVVGRTARLAGVTLAGGVAIAALQPGETVRVTTGAPVPPGTARVIPWEAVSVDGDAVTISAVPARRHIRARCSDFQRGDVLLRPGRILDARALVVAAAGDLASLPVWRQPRVAIVATGDELVAPGQAQSADALIPDSLSIAIGHYARSHGAIAKVALLLPDDRAIIASGVGTIVGGSDLVIMVGGASKGERDYAKAALTDLGMQLVLADVAIKPGKPLWFGRLGGTLVLGLPGNPTAAMTTACLFLAPLLAKLNGAPDGETPRWHRAPLATDVPANGEREAFLCASLIDGHIHVLDRQSAASQFLLADADILMRQAAHTPALRAGDMAYYAAM